MILYLGNKNSSIFSNINLLGCQLKDFYEIIMISSVSNKFFRFLHIMIEIIKHKNSCKLIIVDTYSGWDFYYAVMASFFAKRFKIPYISILHDNNLVDRVYSDRHLSNYLFKDSYINISFLPYQQREFKNLGYKTVYIKNCVNIRKYPFKRREYISPNIVYMVYEEDLYSMKKVVEAFNMVLAKYTDATLTIIKFNKSKFSEKFNSFIQELHSKQIIYEDSITQKRWLKLSMQYDIFISFNMVLVSLIEAMANGFIIISSYTKDISHIVENEKNILLVESNDYISIGNKILRVLKKPILCKDLSINAREISKEYDWHLLRYKWLNLIENAMKNS